MINFDLRFVGTVSNDELRMLLKPENREELKDRMDKYRSGCVANDDEKGSEQE